MSPFSHAWICYFCISRDRGETPSTHSSLSAVVSGKFTRGNHFKDLYLLICAGNKTT